MTTGDVWQQLLSSALVGVDKRRVALTGVEGPLETVVATGDLDPDGLLSAAAAVTLARRGGFPPVKGVERVVAPPDTAQPVPAAAAERLARLLSDAEGFIDRRTRRELIREWLELASEREFTAPPHLLVALADVATSEAALRQLVRAAGGSRLAWLAELGPGRWAWALPEAPSEPDEREWHTGSIDVRARYLLACRQSDPAHGRRLLTESWPAEKAVDLATLMRACREGLSLEDEAWLEKALDDRRGQVREAAAELLAALPDSAYRLRMAERVLACCKAEGDHRLSVTPPAEFDAALRRDGLTNKPPYGMGERAWLLLQIVSAAPLSCWEAIDDDPSKVLARKVNDDWRTTLLQGWARAAVVQASPQWALAVYRSGYDGAPGSTAEIVALLSPEDAAEVARDAVKGRASRMNELLAALPRPWTREVSEIVLEYLSRPEQRQRGGWSTLTYLAETGFAPDMLERVVEIVRSCEDEGHSAALGQLASLLHIRSKIRREFQ